ncbi:MAG: helix-turn-helix domain-containing protein [Sphingomonadales bacterium]
MKRLREAKGFSQERLGFECGRDRTYISGIERRVRNPTVTVVDEIARALGVTASQLLDEPTT